MTDDIFDLYEADVRRCYAASMTDTRREMRMMVFLAALCEARGAKVVLRDLGTITDLAAEAHAHVHAEFYPEGSR